MAEMIYSLPSDVKIEIFSQLPVDSILQCQRVCKTWRACIHELINDSSFINTHTQRLLSSSSSSSPTSTAAVSSFTSFLAREKRSKHGKFHIVGSCNGLICFIDDDKNYSPYICNPVTREYVNLPAPSCKGESGNKINKIIAIGFGYLPSTNEYKFVRIAFDWMRKIYISVYTLGSGTWSIQEAPNFSSHLGCITRATAGFHYNGVIYWNTIASPPFNHMISFDLELERFRIHRSIISVEACMLGGSFCYIRTHDREVRDEQEILFWEESTNFDRLIRIKPKLEKDFTPPIALEEKILLSYDYMKFVSNDPKTSSHSQLVDWVEILLPYMSKFEMIPYMMSLVSIRALGENVCVVDRKKEKLMVMFGN